jgi:hypothetical protein
MNATDKLRAAQAGATLFASQIVDLPTDVKLMAVELVTKLIFRQGVKPEKRIELFDAWSLSIREAIKPESKSP